MYIWHNKNVQSDVQKSLEINSLEKKAMIKASEIDTTNVTPEQIGMVWKYFVGSLPFYKCYSESDPFKQYIISWSREHGFSCTCKAGLNGFANCKDGCCKHVKWALACERETRAAIAELEAAITVEKNAAPVVDQVTRARIQAANERAATKPASKAACYQPKGFSLLR
jgi:hypothetical protein